MRWDPPDSGTWWLELEHFPVPASGIFVDLFPPVTEGWARGAAKFGLSSAPALWGTANSWLYYSSGAQPAADPALDALAAEARAGAWWRDETRAWHEVERPRVVAANLALQAEDLSTCDDAGLADHLRRCFDQFTTAAPLHFEHGGRHVVNEVLQLEAAAAGCPVDDLRPLLTGGSSATVRPAALVTRIGAAVTAAGRAVTTLTSLDDVRSASAEAADALDAYLDEFGWRLVESYDPSFPALVERPSMVVSAVRAAMSGGWRASAAAADVAPPWLGVVPADVAARLDELLADARAAYALRDDDDGTCFFWPMGLVRRALLEVGGRAAADGRLAAADDVFEADAAEALLLAAGDKAAPRAADLGERSATRAEAGTVVPPPVLGDGAVPADDGRGVAPDAILRGIAIGTGVGRGRVMVHRSGDDTLTRIEPGDVLVAVTTTPAFNTLFPLLGAVVVEHGSVGSHAAVLSRELGVPAVVGAAGAMAALTDGMIVEVDGDLGEVRIVSS